MTKYARYEHEGGVSYGIVEGEDVHEISAAPYEEYERTGESAALSDVRLLAPVMPGKIVAIGAELCEPPSAFGFTGGRRHRTA